MEKKILVTGATGKQGRALIAALQPAADTPSEFQIIALTRNVASPAAVSLKSFPNVRLAQADLDKPETVKKVFEDEGGKGSIWGMYVVLAFPGLGADASGEEKQGKVSLFIMILEFGFTQTYATIGMRRSGSGVRGVTLRVLICRTRW